MADHATATISDGWRIVLPARVRQSLNWQKGDELTVTVENGAVRLSTIENDVREMQEFLDKYIPPGVSLADELIRDRREEAARD